jgi:hypothetical protein
VQSLISKAQEQIYNDAPYAWIGVLRTQYLGATIVAQKNMINSYYVDPVWTGEDSVPIFNTVTFA